MHLAGVVALALAGMTNAGQAHLLDAQIPKAWQDLPQSSSVGPIVAEIQDPATGRRWLLERDLAHPGGPGRLVEAEGSGATKRGSPTRRRRPVIHAGDRVVVEEDTATVRARLEAVALATACAGTRLKVRLRIGGRLVPVVALAPGRARLLPESGGWR